MGSSDAPRADDPALPKRVLRTVSPAPRGRPDTEMDIIGWGIFLGLLILLVPMLPFLVIGFLIFKVLAVIDTVRPGGPLGE